MVEPDDVGAYRNQSVEPSVHRRALKTGVALLDVVAEQDKQEIRLALEVAVHKVSADNRHAGSEIATLHIIIPLILQFWNNSRTMTFPDGSRIMSVSGTAPGKGV